MPSKKVSLHNDNGFSFIDPDDADSHVAWNVSVNQYGGERSRLYMESNVILADCNRVVKWGFYGPDDLPKIDKAIEELQLFRGALKEACVVMARAKEEAKAKKAKGKTKSKSR